MANNTKKMQKKNSVKMDTMLLQEILLQQRKICFLWNSERKKIQPMKLKKKIQSI